MGRREKVGRRIEERRKVDWVTVEKFYKGEEAFLDFHPNLAAGWMNQAV